MKKLTVLLCTLFSICNIYTQKYRRPVFERTDNYQFHLDSVEVTKDSTFLYFTYDAERGSWANLSDETYIRNTESDEVFTIKTISGIPFRPKKRHYTTNERHAVKIGFQSINHLSKFDFIENPEDSSSFNIWGINILNKYDSDYALEDYYSDYNLAAKFDSIADYDQASHYKQAQLEKAKYLFGDKSMHVASILYDLNLFSFSKKDYIASIHYGELSISVLKDLPGNYEEDIARIESSLMAAYVLLGKYEDAAIHGDKSLRMRRKLWGAVPELAVYLDYMARIYYYTLGSPSRALLYEQESSEIFLKSYGNHSNSYIQTLTNISVFYREIGEYEKAVDVASKAYSLRKDSVDKLQLALNHNYAVSLCAIKKYDEALYFVQKAQDLLSVLGELKSSDMVQSLTLEGDIYRHKCEYSHSSLLYEKALNILSLLEGKHSKLYADLLLKKGKLSELSFHFDELIYYDSLAMSVLKSYGNNSIYYADASNNYAKDLFLYNREEIDTISHYMITSSNVIKNHINNSIFYMTPHSRCEYWHSNYMHLFDDFIPAMAFLTNTDSLNALCYDALLFSKGFLLDIEKNTKRSFCQDSTLKASLDSLRQLYVIQNQMMTSTSDPTSLDLGKINKRIEESEIKLSREAQKNGKILPKDLTWNTIRNSLKDSDTAIEFGSFDYSKDSTFYFAVLVNKAIETPKLIRLFEEKQIKEFLRNDNLDKCLLQRLIWNPLLCELKGMENVYFSASGLLNAIEFEYFIPQELEHINFFRLSSTKELCRKQETPRISAALFGGLNYDCISSSDSISKNKHIDDVDIRGAFDYLPHTLDEVSSIEHLLSESNIQCYIFSKDSGTEACFNDLQNRNINILHLATHGMFVHNEEVSQKSFLWNIPFLDDNLTTNEDSSLNRSFLLLSGANRRITREGVSENTEDGILTALEISHQDYKGLDLVVLSACDSGIGEINSEGVFGLQRGFKKAGANTILMSLHKVDDEATQILMVEFYRNLMNGKSKHQSLKDAQKYLRKVDNGKYDDPKYWAAFIMLDALD